SGAAGSGPIANGGSTGSAGSGGAAGGAGGSDTTTPDAGGAGGMTTSDAAAETRPADATTGALKIVEWMIPRAAAFPHDPAVDSKGVGWWVDSDNSYIGRWDPATGATMDWPTPTPNCYPHGINPDDQDNLWYTGNRCGRIGKVNPTTGMITEYQAMAADPHSLVFHRGAMWFTAQNAARYGRVNVSDGTVQIWNASAGSKPYGLWPAPDGTLWVALFGTNKVGQVDPANPTMMREVTLPNGGARPRRIAVDTAGHVYYTDHARGFLGRFDPAANAFKEWRSPAGAGSQPYGITVGPDKRIYYCESGADTIAVFDPATEKFEVVAIPTKGSVVRNMTTDFARRRVWLGLSGVRRMAYIDVP
ncbi:MAG TPA: hypothetical protein VGG33_26980, partial [Polyangia bacterium]